MAVVIEIAAARADRTDADDFDPEVVAAWDAFQAARAAERRAQARAQHPAGSNLRS